ncbi:P-loop containing nucleoside triphosphate hydrolase protein [Nemania sp. FL0031]|nr:P-loop containing nucleoside triphosphate hydrolase protein [Nemania sp. FL0031]
MQQLQSTSTRDLSGNVPLAPSRVFEQLSAGESSRVDSPCYQLDSRNVKFVGRSEELKQIKQALAIKSPSFLCTVIVSGGAGIGKSSLALEAAHQLRSEHRYDAILWVNAENRDVLRESFTKLALRLLSNDAVAGADKDFNFMFMKNWMDKTKKTWLLIYDNVHDFDLLDEYLPPNNTGSMIITSRFEAPSYIAGVNTTHIQLQKFDSAESLELFNNLRLSRDPTCNIDTEHEQIQELLESVDGLALGIKQTAFYIASNKLSITGYQEQYSQMAKYILDRKSDSEERHSLGTLWNIQFQDIHSSSASKLLAILSLAHPDDFPTELLECDEHEVGDWASFCTDPKELGTAINSLTDKALIETGNGNNRISIHRLTQQAFIHSPFGLAEHTNLFEIGEMSECKELLNIAADACEDKESLEFAWLCNTFVCVAVDENDHATARSYSEKAISIREAKLEPTAIDLVNSYNNYGNTLNNECKYDEAIVSFKKAYNVLKDVRIGQDNIIYCNLTSLNMARSYALKGDTDNALLLLDEVDRFFTKQGHKAFLTSVYLTRACHLLTAGKELDALQKLEEARTLAKEVLPYGMMLAAVHDFESALQLAELHKREGEIARASWYLAESISYNSATTESDKHEASKLFTRARNIKESLWRSKEKFVLRESQINEGQEYDLLVCTWFRANIF